MHPLRAEPPEETGHGYGRAQVIHFIDFQAGVDLSASIQNLINLICGNRIQTAAKGVELDQIQIIPGLYIVCSGIQTGMIHPLVIDTDGTFHRHQMGDRILCQNRNSVAVDQIRDAMMDFRVYMVRSAGQNNSSASGFIQIFQGLLAFFLNVFMYESHFLPGLMGCGFYLLCRKLFEDFQKTFGHDLFRS